jgi:hypothetical protein
MRIFPTEMAVPGSAWQTTGIKERRTVSAESALEPGIARITD